jgi:hypothetical protein
MPLLNFSVTENYAIAVLDVHFHRYTSRANLPTPNKNRGLMHKHSFTRVIFHNYGASCARL